MTGRDDATRSAERAVLGAMLFHPSAINEALAYLDAEQFAEPRHGYVYVAITALHARGVPAGVPAVLDELARLGNLHGALDGSFDSDIPARRAPKHARHLMRLVDQGYELYTTGHLRIRLEDPQKYLDFGERVAADPQTAVPFMVRAEARFDAARTVLSDEPRVGVVQGWLNRVRAEYYIAPKEQA